MNNKTNMRERLKMSTRAYLNIYMSFPLFLFQAVTKPKQASLFTNNKQIDPN